MGNLKKLKIVGILFAVLVVMFFPKLQALADSVGTYVMPTTTTTVNYVNDALEASRASSTYYSTEEHENQMSDFLGAAQHFNVFARNATLTTNTNGNIAAQNFSAGNQSVDVWRDRDKKDLTNNDDDYFQNILSGTANLGNDITSHIVLGKMSN
jgi:hypothetical protein